MSNHLTGRTGLQERATELAELRVQYAESVHRHAKAVATRKLHEQMAKEQLDLFGEDDG